MITNVAVMDIQNTTFYESFDRVTGIGGNDQNYSFDDIRDNCSIANENMLSFFSTLDHPNDKVQDVYQTNKSIYFNLLSSSKYQITKIPFKKPIHCKLSFWTAGNNSETWENRQYLEVTINGKNEVYDYKEYDYNEIPSGKWRKQTLSFYLNNQNTDILFQGEFVFLDDVMITEVTDTLDESKANNEELLSSYSGKTINLALKRTLQKDIWNTLCLPFEFTNSSIEGADIEIERLKSVSDGVFHFEPDATVPAGEPFILKTSQTIANPKFNAVTISATTPGTAGDAESGYYLQGIFSPIALSTDGSNIFLATDGKLYKPAPSTNNMNGLRAYMVVPSTSRASRLMHDPYGTTGIQQQPATTKRPTTFYNLWGQAMGSSLQQLPKGIYIANGRKMLKK